MMVAVALFAVVMLVAGATLISLVYANRKAQALQSVMNNLNISLDEMVRAMREGQNYRCNGYQASFGDCASGGSVVYFTPFGSSADDQPADDWGYAYGASYCGAGRLCEEKNGGPWIPITSPEVQIQSMVFYVVGTKPASLGGTQQAKIVFTVKGQAGAQASTQTTFSIQATAVQRLLNL